MFEGIKEGDTVSAIVVIKTIAHHKTRNDKPYMRLTVNDGISDVTVFVWDPLICTFKENDTIKLKGTYGKYDDKDKIDAISMEATKQKLKLPSLNDQEREDYIRRFYILKNGIKDNDFLIALNHILSEKIWDSFITAPAAKGNHQAYLGGLLEHSVTVAELAKSMYDLVPENINIDLLITGALLHDIGKIKEYEYETVFERTMSGKLIGHTSLGLLIISRLLPDGFPVKKSTELLHLILSHHGKRDWGAPVEPMMKEAVILHNSDMVDSYSGRFDKLKTESKDSEWSEFDKTYNRQWYLKSTSNEDADKKS